MGPRIFLYVSGHRQQNREKKTYFPFCKSFFFQFGFFFSIWFFFNVSFQTNFSYNNYVGLFEVKKIPPIKFHINNYNLRWKK